MFSNDKSPFSQNNKNIEGIVYQVNSKKIVLSFDEMYDFEGLKGNICLILLANEITYKRYQESIQYMKEYINYPNSHLIEVIF